MACTATADSTELEFVNALHVRAKSLYDCRGPLLRLGLWAWRLNTLEQIFDSETASDILWAGHHTDGCVGVHFSLCAAHWIDLAGLVWARAHQHRRPTWAAEADHLLRDVCGTAGWDPKEILNLMQWRRVRLT